MVVDSITERNDTSNLLAFVQQTRQVDIMAGFCQIFDFFMKFIIGLAYIKANVGDGEEWHGVGVGGGKSLNT